MKENRLIIALIITTVLVGKLISAKGKELRIETVALTDEERLLVTMAKGPTNIYKHRIFGNLPKGTQVRVRIESYHRGEKSADSRTLYRGPRETMGVTLYKGGRP